MKYRYDYHIHTIHSGDGKSTLFEVCESAINKGLKEIAITEHFEPISTDKEYKFYKPLVCRDEINEANEIYKGKLKIKMGIELGQPHLFLESSNSILKATALDYVIGSAHKLPGDTDVSQLDYNRISSQDACELYINQITQLVNTADFDCVGHLDLIKRYSTSTYKRRITLMDQYELLKEVLKLIISKGKGIEINTSGLRQAPRETMPGLDVLKLYSDLGGEILTIGSDAHRYVDVGEGIDTAIENAKEAGFKHLTIFKDRKPEWINISEKSDVYYMDSKKAACD